MSKLYIVFAGPEYYPTGADVHSIHRSEDEAVAEAKKVVTAHDDPPNYGSSEHDWSKVMFLDTETLERGTTHEFDSGVYGKK